MNGDALTGNPDLASKNPGQSTQYDGSTRPPQNRARWTIWLTVVVVCLVSAVGLWKYQRKLEPENVPPFPSGIEEPEVIVTLQKKREEVVANPKSADLWGEYGMLLIAQLHNREADICFGEANRLNPNDPRWPYTRGHIALKADSTKAEAYLRQAIATDGAGQEYRSIATILLAEWKLEQGDLEEASALFAKEAGSQKGQPRADYGLAMVAVQRGDEATATRMLTSLLSSEFTKKYASVHLARLARLRGDVEAAKQFESAAAELPDPPNWPDPMYDVINTLAVGRRGRERMISFYENRQDYRKAKDMYLAELEIERSPKALLGAGVNYVRIKDYERGIALLREALALEPNSPNATYTLALAIFTQAEREADLNPTSPELAKWFQEVIVYAKRTTELKPDHAKAFLFWGLSLKHLGDPKGAIEPLHKGLIAGQHNFDLHMAMGQVLAQVGDKTEAEKYFKCAHKINRYDPSPTKELEKLHDKKP